MTSHAAAATPRNDLTNEQFFRAFLASLRLRGLEFVDTRGDTHHKRFRRVVAQLSRAQEEGRAEALAMPRTLMPSPFTDRYQEFDDALIRLQRGLLGSQNPFYPGIALTLSENRAQSIIGRLPTDQQELIKKLADVYVGNGSSSSADAAASE